MNGLAVWLMDADRDALSRATTAISSSVKRFVSKGLISKDFGKNRFVQGSNLADPTSLQRVVVRLLMDLINGTSGIEIASGLHWYLKYKCHGHVSWDKEKLQRLLSEICRFKYKEDYMKTAETNVWSRKIYTIIEDIFLDTTENFRFRKDL